MRTPPDVYPSLSGSHQGCIHPNRGPTKWRLHPDMGSSKCAPVPIVGLPEVHPPRQGSNTYYTALHYNTHSLHYAAPYCTTLHHTTSHYTLHTHTHATHMLSNPSAANRLTRATRLTRSTVSTDTLGRHTYTIYTHDTTHTNHSEH